MSETVDSGVHVVRAGDLSDAAQQTPGMVRRAAVGPSVSRGLWVGRVSTEPGFSSGAHHHGEAETVGHVLTGKARIRYGEGYAEYVDLGPGDFVYTAHTCRTSRRTSVAPIRWSSSRSARPTTSSSTWTSCGDSPFQDRRAEKVT